MESNEAILAELQTIFRDILDQPALTITPASTAQTVEDWDSFAHIVIVRAIEKHYGIKFALNEVGNLQNVGEMVDLVQAKLQAR